jgi:hypothetical protein
MKRIILLMMLGTCLIFFKSLAISMATQKAEVIALAPRYWGGDRRSTHHQLVILNAWKRFQLLQL